MLDGNGIVLPRLGLLPDWVCLRGELRNIMAQSAQAADLSNGEICSGNLASSADNAMRVFLPGLTRALELRLQHLELLREDCIGIAALISRLGSIDLSLRQIVLIFLGNLRGG